MHRISCMHANSKKMRYKAGTQRSAKKPPWPVLNSLFSCLSPIAAHSEPDSVPRRTMFCIMIGRYGLVADLDSLSGLGMYGCDSF